MVYAPQALVLRTIRQTFPSPVPNVSLFARAWEECPELQVRSKAHWLGTTLDTLFKLEERYDIALWTPEGEPVGGLILTLDEDIHVGTCMSVVAQYVFPEYRNKGVSLRCMREAMRIARERCAPVLAFTHRIGDWRYETIYKELA